MKTLKTKSKVFIISAAVVLGGASAYTFLYPHKLDRYALIIGISATLVFLSISFITKYFAFTKRESGLGYRLLFLGMFINFASVFAVFALGKLTSVDLVTLVLCYTFLYLPLYFMISLYVFKD